MAEPGDTVSSADQQRPVPVVLGVLNVTPDSFSDGGLYTDVDSAVARAHEMLTEGADIIDVGGESTRPGAAPVDPVEEAARVVPVIEAIAPFCRVAVDTRHESVARAAVTAGATIINDVAADLWPVAAELGVGWIAMHMQGEPGTMQRDPTYSDVVTEVRDFLVARAETAAAAGVREIWIDPGFGFGKTLDHNLLLLAHIDRLVATGWPVAVGTSRKTMLGQLIARSDGADQQTPLEDRLVGSVTTAAYAMLQGVALIRVHDVKAAKQAATVVAGER
ncbi:MAG: dihydropteroate synthase [Actinomycetota bacterium]